MHLYNKELHILFNKSVTGVLHNSICSKCSTSLGK